MTDEKGQHLSLFDNIKLKTITPKNPVIAMRFGWRSNLKISKAEPGMALLCRDLDTRQDANDAGQLLAKVFDTNSVKITPHEQVLNIERGKPKDGRSLNGEPISLLVNQLLRLLRKI